MSEDLRINQKNTSLWNFDNSYARLPEFFFARINPVTVRSPSLIIFNNKLADELGLNSNELGSPEGLAILAGNLLPAGAEAIAQAYAGHQFGHFTMLGDGRAIVLGEHLTPTGNRFDLQLKGSGRTPFSRRGDGRAALGPMLREYIISEAMYALKIPSTRSLAVVTTGEEVLRETVLAGAILTRVAASHIRVGTFEYAARYGDLNLVKQLADYTISRHYPEILNTENIYLSFLESVIERQASLITKWLQVGFIHGVMNTDNMAISGETIDYGPCAFMDQYDDQTVFSSIDRSGRYSYGNQALIAQWNLARFAESIIGLLDECPEKALANAQQAVEQFTDKFNQYWIAGMHKKLGIFNQEIEDLELFDSLLDWMKKNQVDYTNNFRALASNDIPDGLVYENLEFKTWHQRWQARLDRQSEPRTSAYHLMNIHNPAVIPRNHKVEEALNAATVRADYSIMQKLLSALENPFEQNEQNLKYRSPADSSDSVYRTYCGT